MRVRWVGGALLAAAAAGPLFTGPLMLTAAVGQYGVPGVAAGLLAIAAAAVFTMPVGFIIAILPSLAAAAGLASAGRRWRVARHPLTWAVAGLMIGWMAGTVLTLADDASTSAAQLLAGWPFGAVGAPGAVLACWRTRWPAGLSSTPPTR